MHIELWSLQLLVLSQPFRCQGLNLDPSSSGVHGLPQLSRKTEVQDQYSVVKTVTSCSLGPATTSSGASIT